MALRIDLMSRRRDVAQLSNAAPLSHGLFPGLASRENGSLPSVLFVGEPFVFEQLGSDAFVELERCSFDSLASADIDALRFADVVFVNVGVGDVVTHDALRQCKALAREVVRRVRRNQVVVFVDPAYVGATEELFSAPLAAERGLQVGHDIGVLCTRTSELSTLFTRHDAVSPSPVQVGASTPKCVERFEMLFRDAHVQSMSHAAVELDVILRRHRVEQADAQAGVQADAQAGPHVIAETDLDQSLGSLNATIDTTIELSPEQQLVRRVRAALHGRHRPTVSARVLLVGLDGVTPDRRSGAPRPASAVDVLLLEELVSCGIRVDVHEPAAVGRLVVGDAIVPLVDRPFAAAYDLVVVRSVGPSMELRWLGDARAIIDDTTHRTAIPLTLF